MGLIPRLLLRAGREPVSSPVALPKCLTLDHPYHCVMKGSSELFIPLAVSPRQCPLLSGPDFTCEAEF